MHNAVATSAALGIPNRFIRYYGLHYQRLERPRTSTMADRYRLHLHPPLCLLWLFQAFFLAPVGAKVAHSIDVKPLKNALPACSAAFAFTCLDKPIWLG